MLERQLRIKIPSSEKKVRKNLESDELEGKEKSDKMYHRDALDTVLYYLYYQLPTYAASGVVGPPDLLISRFFAKNGIYLQLRFSNRGHVVN